jgi:hypothetical protein
MLIVGCWPLAVGCWGEGFKVKAKGIHSGDGRVVDTVCDDKTVIACY